MLIQHRRIDRRMPVRASLAEAHRPASKLYRHRGAADAPDRADAGVLMRDERRVDQQGRYVCRGSLCGGWWSLGPGCERGETAAESRSPCEMQRVALMRAVVATGPPARQEVAGVRGGASSTIVCT
jgi:hypothetical protein